MKHKILKQTQNGKIFLCADCDKYHIEYKNLSFSLNDDDFRYFKKYFLSLQPEIWEESNKDTIYKRKVIVPIGHSKVTALFHAKEIYEIKQLFIEANTCDDNSYFSKHQDLFTSHSLN